MSQSIEPQHRKILFKIAHQAMLEKGLLPDFSNEVIEETVKIAAPVSGENKSIHDLRKLLWCSIDNDDSRDLDQLTVAESLQDGSVKIFIAIADVDILVNKMSAIDDHARHNTTSVYTSGGVFPMLPEKLSTDYTSLNLNVERHSIVVEMIIDAGGAMKSYDIYRSLVFNYAKLSYNRVGQWLDNQAPMPDEIASIKGLGDNIRLQKSVAEKMRALRYLHGALDLETIETNFVFSGDSLQSIDVMKRNDAKGIIQDFMIAANGATARFLEDKKVPSIRRVVRTPKRWDRIVEVAAEYKFKLPLEPDSKELDKFLTYARTNFSERFPDISLAVIKLMGAGEYIVELPGSSSVGHFGLAVKDYSHSTAPNRRYPDLVTQRLLKAAIAGNRESYSVEELQELALHCTTMEDAARKVERQVQKSAAAMLLETRIGEQFDAIVTGASDKGTWVRLLYPPIEGRLVHGLEGIDIGHKIRVQLTDTNVEKGFIDFKRIG